MWTVTSAYENNGSTLESIQFTRWDWDVFVADDFKSQFLITGPLVGHEVWNKGYQPLKYIHNNMIYGKY